MTISSEIIVAVLTLLGTVFAGAGLKLVDRWLSRASSKSQFDSGIREEYRDTISDKRKDIAELKIDLENAKREMDELEKEVTLWRERYYEEFRAKAELVARLRVLEERYKSE